MNLLERLQAEKNLTYLFISHDLRAVRHLSDRVAVMYLGKIVELAPVDTLFERAQHPYTRMLLGAAPSVHASHAPFSRAIAVVGDPPSPTNPPSGCRFRTRCPFAFERCTSEVPKLYDVGLAHTSACHLVVESAVGIQGESYVEQTQS